MNILFENKYKRDKIFAKDIYSFLYFKRPINIFFFILFGLSLVLAIYSFFLVGHIHFTPIVFTSSWCIIFIIAYFINVNVFMKREIESHGKLVDICLTVTDENITLKKSTGDTLTLDYSNIKKITKTKNYIYLTTKSKLIYAFKTDAFTVGTKEDFILFIKSKINKK